ncbi:trypsin-like peptidase domain-containing protein [Clostridium sp.]|uniref:S1C family serine protease n=1 Tax=Clostridium sp. TaxID=1506 RepID=UPI00260E30F9|nr:trypsin-like peptidase domain-containing protein [Clostridium sp.]
MSNDDDKVYDVDNYEEVEPKYFSNESQGLLNEDENFSDYNEKLSSNNKIKTKKKKRSGLGIISLALVAGLLGGLVGGYGMYYSTKSILERKPNLTPNPQSFTTDQEALSASQAFEKVAPAVVIVSVNGLMDYSGFIPQETEGIGSGFIINEEGYILTNYHVIQDAKVVTVTLSDGRDIPAKVVNYDKNQDIAMLKLSDDSIKVPGIVELGDSAVLKPGEEVLAIGTPLSKEFNQTLTGGYVSAVNRSVETNSGIKVNLIQTDAAINPGNSGGPLINTKGQVVGINTLKIADGSVEGIGFAIPINEVSDRIESLSKPILNLGVSIREINSDLSKQYDMEEGLYIAQVSEFSPAEKAGLQIGDIIVKFDGTSIKTFDELKKIRDTKYEGDIVEVEVVRNGGKKTFNVKLEVK